jgi:hypothetical protein
LYRQKIKKGKAVMQQEFLKESFSSVLIFTNKKENSEEKNALDQIQNLFFD